MSLCTYERLCETLDYDPESGIFVWRVRAVLPGKETAIKLWNGRYAGTVAGCKWKGKKSGPYWQICVDNKIYRASRLAWFYMTGAWPDGEVDHKDCDGLNNRWGNLRLASRSQNGANRFIQSNNVIGVKGVRLTRGGRRYSAQITVRRKSYHLGTYDTSEEAFAAYVAAAEKYFGHFARCA